MGMIRDGQDFDALLASYVAGNLAEPARVLVRSHLEINPANRSFIRDMEAMAGEMLEEIEPVSISGRDDRLDAIFASRPIEAPQPAMQPSTSVMHDALPLSLRQFIGCDLKDIPWRTRLPGLKEYRLDDMDGCHVSMLWIRSGQAMPTHTHSGTELTLVLEGGFSDGVGHYVRGDVSFADDTVDHRPVADDDGDCICFAVTEGDLRLTGPVGRFFAPFIRG